METVAEIWAGVLGPMKDAEDLMRSQRAALNLADQQAEAYREVIRGLARVCDEYNVPVLKVAAAMTPLFRVGPTPVQEMGPGHTEAMERDSLEHIRNADAGTEGGRPTLRLETVRE